MKDCVQASHSEKIMVNDHVTYTQLLSDLVGM